VITKAVEHILQQRQLDGTENDLGAVGDYVDREHVQELLIRMNVAWPDLSKATAMTMLWLDGYITGRKSLLDAIDAAIADAP
jgi:hypothetical protein